MSAIYRSLIALLLALSLLLAQLGSFAHALEHLPQGVGVQQKADENASHDRHERDTICPSCISYASLGAGAHTSALCQHTLATCDDVTQIQFQNFSPTKRAQAHRARAPPAFS